MSISQEIDIERTLSYMNGKASIAAVAYLRTSSATNSGEGKDSERRQAEAIQQFADRHGYEIVETFRDMAVSGGDAVDARPGFRSMMDMLLANGTKTIIVENASRFSRDLIVSETGYAMLRERGIDLIAADSPSSFLDDGPTATMVRQILASVSQFEKAMVVSKLKGARDRLRATGRKVEGRKNYFQIDPELVALARKLHRYPVNGKRRSLAQVADALAEAGYLSSTGTKYTATAVRRMLGARQQVKRNDGAAAMESKPPTDPETIEEEELDEGPILNALRRQNAMGQQ